MTQSPLNYFNLTQADLLGEGGEAQVYALDADRVVRMYRPGATLAGAEARAALLAEIAAGAGHLPFTTPQVIEVGELAENNGRVYVIEKRIPGTSMLQALEHSSGSTRSDLISQYMEAAWQLGTLKLQRPFFGEISHEAPVQTATLEEYLAERAGRSLAGVTSLAHVDPAALAHALGEPMAAPVFVHIDYFPGNVMVNNNQLNAVIDFGYSSSIGDRRMTVMAAAAHLVSPRISPTVTEADRVIALDWLRERDLFDYYERGLPWLAAYWSFVPEADDPAAYAWCHSILR